VHRLDKNTTGLIIIARNKLAYEALTEQISKNAIKRKYLAIVHKQFTENHLLLKLPISRIKNKSQFVVSRNKTAKDSITEIHVIKNLHNAALIECELKTGRTHQIRVHLAYIKHPIFNDSIYGKNDGYKDYEQFLCANYISFFHPKTLKKMEFTIKPDRIFNELLQKLQ
jgi:23S rRNA pseudouridine1911/1915/1917 synthase